MQSTRYVRKNASLFIVGKPPPHGSMLVMLTASAAAYDALHILQHYFSSLPQSIRFSEHPSLQDSASRTSPCRPTHHLQIKPL